MISVRLKMSVLAIFTTFIVAYCYYGDDRYPTARSMKCHLSYTLDLYYSGKTHGALERLSLKASTAW